MSPQTLQILESRISTILVAVRDTQNWIERREDPQDDEAISILAGLDNIEAAAARLKREMENL